MKLVDMFKCRSNSNGGDIDAAMRAGHFIREKNGWTYVRSNQSCASACVLLFLGGVSRYPVPDGGKIGLHRPYSVKYALTKSEAADSYEKINNRIKQYLRQMNIPEGLLDKMNSVSPGQIRWLRIDNDKDLQELMEMQIIGSDPIWQDQLDSGVAKRLGISKQEFYTRQQRANAVCPDLYVNPMQYLKCRKKIVYGDALETGSE
jgi:hypothetical protein